MSALCSRCGKRPAISEPSPGNGDRMDLCGRCLALTCPDCGQAYRGNAGHCRGGRYEGCCKSWATSRDFDLHRTGTYEPNARRCLTTDEMLAEGWAQDPGGYWASPATLRDRDRQTGFLDSDGRPGTSEQPDLDSGTTSAIQGPLSPLAR